MLWGMYLHMCCFVLHTVLKILNFLKHCGASCMILSKWISEMRCDALWYVVTTVLETGSSETSVLVYKQRSISSQKCVISVFTTVKTSSEWFCWYCLNWNFSRANSTQNFLEVAPLCMCEWTFSNRNGWNEWLSMFLQSKQITRSIQNISWWLFEIG
jgi:hypothetical protein